MQETITLPQTPPSKKTGIKPLLTERLKKEYPSFRFLTFATGVYHFQRMKEFRDFDLREALHIVLYVEEKRMHASISSRLNHVHTLSPIYNNGFINPHVDLLAIKTGNTLPTDDAAYHYDGTPDGLREMINLMVNDFGNTGIPWLDNRWNDLRANTLVKTGLDMIDGWDFDRTMLRNELNVQLRKARHSVGNLRHPLLNDLRDELAAVPGQSSEAVNEIPRLAFELMELYCNSQIA
jgi:hypothetical protein